MQQRGQWGGGGWQQKNRKRTRRDEKETKVRGGSGTPKCLLRGYVCRVCWITAGRCVSGLEWRLYFILTATESSHPTLLSCSPSIPWAEQPLRLIITKTSPCKTVFFLFYFCFVLVFCFALKKSLVSLSGCPNITKVELQWMPQPGHVDVNVVVIYSGLIQVNAHTRRLCDPSDMPEWCPQISFLFFFLFFETELASARSQAPLYISLQWDFSCHFSQEELINIPQNTPTKRTRCLFALRRNRKYFCFCFLCVVLGDFLSRITISHPCSHQTVFRQFAHRRCTASASVSDGCQHDHGTRHQMADLGSVSWVSERHLLAVWRWV